MSKSEKNDQQALLDRTIVLHYCIVVMLTWTLIPQTYILIQELQGFCVCSEIMTLSINQSINQSIQFNSDIRGP